MALVPIRVDRTSKPPVGTPLRSDGHWSVQGLVGGWAFNEGAGRSAFNVVTGKPLTTLIESTWRPDGLYRNGAAYSGEVAAYGGIAPITGEHGVTLTWLGVSGAAGTRGLCNLGTTLNTATCGLLGSDTGDGLRFFCRDLAGNTYNAENSAVDIVDGKPHVLSVTGRLGMSNMSVSVDGQHLFNAVKPATYTPYGFNVVVFGGLHRGSPELAGPATHILGLIHVAEHSPSQIASLAANPWQIYEPETVWIEVGGALSFAGVCASSQPLQISYASGELRFDGNLIQAQPTQVEALSSVLAFVASAGQSQAAQSEIAAALLSFQGRIYQSQGEQLQAASDLVEKINAILRVTSSDPLALRISVRDPLALMVTVH